MRKISKEQSDREKMMAMKSRQCGMTRLHMMDCIEQIRKHCNEEWLDNAIAHPPTYEKD